MPEFKRTFDEDLFNRKPYAEFLKTLILNSGAYHRDDDVKAYTIAIDSPWGTGKSVFLEKFENLLMSECGDTLRMVHYNAWKNDFWNNAFEPFAEAVFSDPLFAATLGDQKSEQAIKKIGSAAKHLALAFAKKGLENYFDADQMMKAAENVSGAAGAYTSNESSAISPAYSSFKQNLKDMQEGIRAVLEALNGGKLVIVIDELDRCRPTFAVETLEIVKHIMDVENVVYIFALDVKQLGAAIRQVYGADTDATGYLMRFFSYYSRMPEADVEAMVSDMNLASGAVPNAAETLSLIAEEFGLNARDIETVGKVFTLMENQFLKDYNSSVAYKLYWILLCYKYKQPLDYNEKMKGNWSLDEKNKGAFLEKKSKSYEMEISLRAITQNSKIKDLALQYFPIGSHNGFEIGKVFKVDISADREAACVHANSTVDYFSNKDSLSGFLFFHDLKRWDEIKDLTPAQFLLQQMEMFNFLPQIPSATE